jgi:hypothetical protein
MRKQETAERFAELKAALKEPEAELKTLGSDLKRVMQDKDEIDTENGVVVCTESETLEADEALIKRIRAIDPKFVAKCTKRVIVVPKLRALMSVDKRVDKTVERGSQKRLNVK